MKRATQMLLIACLCVTAWVTPGTVRAQFNPYNLFLRNQAAQQNVYRQQAFSNQMAQFNATTYGIPAYSNAYNPFYAPAFTPAFSQPSLPYIPNTPGPVINSVP